MKNYKYCPYCGSANRKYKEFFGCPKCGKKVFINSHPTASAFIIENGKYCLSKRAIEPKKGALDVIGGFLKEGEHPETGILREFKEETGLTVKIINFLGIYLDKYEYQGDLVNTLNFYYIAKIVKGVVKPHDDIESVEWFLLGQIPKNIAFNHIRRALKDLQELNVKK